MVCRQVFSKVESLAEGGSLLFGFLGHEINIGVAFISEHVCCEFNRGILSNVSCCMMGNGKYIMLNLSIAR